MSDVSEFIFITLNAVSDVNPFWSDFADIPIAYLPTRFSGKAGPHSFVGDAAFFMTYRENTQVKSNNGTELREKIYIVSMANMTYTILVWRSTGHLPATTKHLTTKSPDTQRCFWLVFSPISWHCTVLGV